jgi:hypothetical protein
MVRPSYSRQAPIKTDKGACLGVLWSQRADALASGAAAAPGHAHSGRARPGRASGGAAPEEAHADRLGPHREHRLRMSPVRGFSAVVIPRSWAQAGTDLWVGLQVQAEPNERQAVEESHAVRQDPSDHHVPVVLAPVG